MNFYLDNARYCNNWDLVDLSAPYILGEHLLDNPSPILLDNLSRSNCMWEQRIAIVATLTLIRNNKFSETLRLAEKYLTHKHLLIHKATGWMLREVGKRDKATLLNFLDTHARQMPRIALRYAIEKLSPEERKFYLSLK